jgi:hypothetical protein
MILNAFKNDFHEYNIQIKEVSADERNIIAKLN